MARSRRDGPISSGQMRLAIVALLLAPSASVVRPKLTTVRPGPNLKPPARVPPPAVAPGERDVIVKLYDILSATRFSREVMSG